MRTRRMRANQQPFVETAAERLEEEIEALEKRLSQIGPDGDCAYEKAMIRFFEQQLGMRRELLSTSK